MLDGGGLEQILLLKSSSFLKRIENQYVIPAQAGTHLPLEIVAEWVPACAGMTHYRDDTQ